MLLAVQKVAENAKSCSKVAEHNLFMRNHGLKRSGQNRAYGEDDGADQWYCGSIARWYSGSIAKISRAAIYFAGSLLTGFGVCGSFAKSVELQPLP